MRPSHSYDAAIQLQPVICCSIRLGCLFDNMNGVLLRWVS